MVKFFKTHIKIFVAICAAVAVTLGITAAVVTVKLAKRVASTELSHTSYISSTSEVVSVPQESVPQDNGIRLQMLSPTKNDITVNDSFYTFKGTSDPAEPLIMNEQAVERTEDGTFAVEVNLNAGPNTFTFIHKGESVTYTIRYNYVVIKAYSPYQKQQYEAGSTFAATVLARVGSSQVTATFNGVTIALQSQPYEEGAEFTNFTGSFTMPTGNDEDINLGGVKFSAVCSGVRNTYTSPAIICLRDTALDRTQIVEIVAEQAETFDVGVVDDCSRPTNSYLPQGTLDYKVGGVAYDAESGNSYYKLRCGKRVYITKKNSPDVNRVTVSKMYQGELPEYNTISLYSTWMGDKHTYFAFDTAWRAPFAVTVAPQSYTNPSKQEYTISSPTYSYIDIKFFYTQGLDGDYTIPEGHPLFSRSEIYSTEDGFVLRLHLKAVGAFYGWNAEYNSAGQLVFSFLHPAKLNGAGDLTGIKILVDAGHGGRDIGAEGLAPKTMYEAERNLNLAFKLKAELEALGATVVMTRTQDVAVSADQRCSILRREAPDLCISIHHDSNGRSSADGASFHHFNPFSYSAAKAVYDNVLPEGFYRAHRTKFTWHYFYMCRVSVCPVVLTENGFISNPTDFEGISSESVNIKKAQAIARGVVEYFNSVGN